MGLFDDAIGSVLNNLGGAGQGASAGGNAGGGNMMQLIMSLLQQHGGLQGLMDQLSKSGLGPEVASWIGKGANLPINANQLSQALGDGPLANLAAQFGLDTHALAGQLAEHLPKAVDNLTPDGQLPQGNDSSALLESGLKALSGKMFG